MTKRIIFDLPEEMARSIFLLSEKRGISRSDLCRYAISKFCEAELDEKTTEPTNNTTPLG